MQTARTAIVTGGMAGIGLATAEALGALETIVVNPEPPKQAT
ncbi:MAG: hypothetical protein ABFS41_13295 [Myxococcota bacterium]